MDIKSNLFHETIKLLKSFNIDIKGCFEKLDYILYSLPQLKNIFEKVFTSESKLEVFNDYDYLIEMLDEVFDDFKYETLRFILEWKNANGNITEIMRIREIKAIKPIASNRKQNALQRSEIVIDVPVSNDLSEDEFNEERKEEQNKEDKTNIFIQDQKNYKKKYEGEEEEEIQERSKVKACGFPYPLKKNYNIDEVYYKLARKSIKSLTQTPKKLFSIDIPNVIK